jgi:hypothetical protein
MRKYITRIEHGVAYFVENGRLMFSPLREDYSIETGTEGEVEEAPKSFRMIHELTAKELGLSKEQLIKQNIK